MSHLFIHSWLGLVSCNHDVHHIQFSFCHTCVPERPHQMLGCCSCSTQQKFVEFETDVLLFCIACLLCGQSAHLNLT